MHILHPVSTHFFTASPFSFLTTVTPPFLGTTCTGLTHLLSDTGYMIHASSSFRTSFFTMLLMIGFILLWCSLEVFESSSNIIWCIQTEGLITFKSEMLYPKVVGYFLKTYNNRSIYSRPKSALTITRRSSSLSRNSYLRFLDNTLSSTGGCFGPSIWSGVSVRHYLKLSSSYGSHHSSSSNIGGVGIFRTSITWGVFISNSFTHSLLMSMTQQVSSMASPFINLDRISLIFSSPTSKVNFPLFTSIISHALAKKGLPNRSRMLESSFIFITTKSVGMYSWPILTGTFSRMPTRYLIEWSANWSYIFVGFRLHRFSISLIEKGVNLTLAPRSHSVLSITNFPITQGMEKLPGSFSFWGILFCMISLHF